MALTMAHGQTARCTAGLLLALGGCAGDARVDGPAGGSEAPLAIAYNVLVDADADDYEIFVMDLDGGNPRNVSNDPGVDWVYHAWRDRLYFVSDRDDERRKYHLYEMDADGGNVRRITDFRVDDSWLGTRADGNELVISSRKDGTDDIYVIDRNGVELARLTNDEHVDNDPVFSPNGDRVVFRSKRGGHDELYVMSAAGGEPVRLTYYPADDESVGDHGYHAGPPFWEPNRDVISYTSRQQGHYDIFTIRPDGSEVRRLTAGPGDEGWHAWSPDGRLLVYDGTGGGAGAGATNYDIYLMDVDAGAVTRLTTDPRYEQGPVFVRAPGRSAAAGG